MKVRYLTSGRVAQLARSVSERDRAIIATLDELRVANTGQLRRLHFADMSAGSAARQAPATLRHLAGLRIVCQLERQIGGVRAGSAAAVWALDMGGQRLASEAGPAGGRRTRRPWTPSLPFVAHRLAVSELYVQLVQASRVTACEVLCFEAEPFCWRRYAAPLGGVSFVKPDAAVRVVVGAFERGAFVEIDRATESRSTIARKCAAYRQYWETGREQARHGYFPQVLFAVPDEVRKAALLDVFGRQPAEAWPLFRVVLAGEVLAALLGTEEGAV